MTSKKIQVEYASPSALKANGYNVNVVSPENETKIDASLSRFGFFKPILCRELKDGTLEIVGGEHRWLSAQRLGHAEVPYINLGPLSDKKAKEIGLVDNGRYGNDDTLRLADLLGELGETAAELASFMPLAETDFNAIFAASSIGLEDLELTEEDDAPPTLPTTRPTQTHSILRFKVPLEDAERVSALVKRVMKAQKFTEADELTNAGDALVHILGEIGAV